VSRAQHTLAHRKSLAIGALAMALALGFAPYAGGAAPSERVRTTLEAVTAILIDPALQGPDREQERQQQLRAIIHSAFDFREMAKETLGSQWAKLTPPQQDEFVGVFGTLFERSYNRLIVRFLGERRTLYGAESLENMRAVVQTTLVSKNEARLPVDYQLISNGQRWAIYDVVIDGVSLATNYRAQFTKILRTSSYEALVQRIRDKLAEERL
jgi:phospholipid transport system substrate-binding protein